MMKKKTNLLLLLCLLLSGFAARAQPVFTITISPVDTVTQGLTDPLDYIEMRSHLVNQTTAPVALSWQLITDTSSYADDWNFFSIADNLLVRSPMSGVFQHVVQKTAPIAPGDSSDMRIFVNVPATSPFGSTGLFKIKVFDSLQTQTDTIVYRICKGTGCILPAYRPGGGTGTISLGEGDASVSVYPNPVTDKVYLKMNNVQVKPSDMIFRIYDYTGRLKDEQYLNSVQQAVDMARYKPGLYFIRLYQKDKYLGGQKIIKQ